MIFSSGYVAGPGGILIVIKYRHLDICLVFRKKKKKQGQVKVFKTRKIIAQAKATVHKPAPALVAQSVECPLRGTWGHGFAPRPRYKNGIGGSSLGIQTYGVELGLVDPVLG